MYKLDILHHSVKSVETKSQKVLGLILTVVEVTGEKLVGGGPFWGRPCKQELNIKLQDENRD